jgi:hypothetical protein
MSIRRRGADEQDYVLRLIRQAAEALRLLRLRLAGGRDAPARVRRQAAAAAAGLLGRDAPLLHALDAASAVRLVADPRRVALWAGLLDVEADAARAEGDAESAAARENRAAALRAAAGLPPRGAGEEGS